MEVFFVSPVVSLPEGQTASVAVMVSCSFLVTVLLGTRYNTKITQTRGLAVTELPHNANVKDNANVNANANVNDNI